MEHTGAQVALNFMNDNLLIPDSSTPSRADAVQNRALLIETARQLFNSHGVEAVSMSQIAREAGVGKGTLYRHFENKMALCQALLDEDQRALQERTFEQLRQSDPPRAKLAWFLEQVVIFVTEHDDLLTAGETTFGATLLAHPAHTWWRDTIRGLLEQIGVETSLDYLTDVLYIMLAPSTIHFQQTHLGYTLDQIIAGLTATLDRLPD